jgi:hypothetical protein
VIVVCGGFCLFFEGWGVVFVLVVWVVGFGGGALGGVVGGWVFVLCCV